MDAVVAVVDAVLGAVRMGVRLAALPLMRPLRPDRKPYIAPPLTRATVAAAEPVAPAEPVVYFAPNGAPTEPVELEPVPQNWPAGPQVFVYMEQAQGTGWCRFRGAIGTGRHDRHELESFAFWMGQSGYRVAGVSEYRGERAHVDELHDGLVGVPVLLPAAAVLPRSWWRRTLDSWRR